jgi:hypothetical protein
MMKVTYRKLHRAFQRFKFITSQGSLSYLHNHSIVSFSHDESAIENYAVTKKKTTLLHSKI